MNEDSAFNNHRHLVITCNSLESHSFIMLIKGLEFTAVP